MKLIALGLNHKTSPVDLRERLAFEDSMYAPILNDLMGRYGFVEALAVSTCNRVEFYLVDERGDEPMTRVGAFLAERFSVTGDELKKYFYHHIDYDAVAHLFSVTSGLDSMVIGEPQITGQVKDAYKIALELKASKSILNKLFHRAFSASKDVRTNTGLGENAVSISYVAVTLAKQIFGDLAGKTVMLVGAGEMAELALKHLIKAEIRKLIVVNRTLAKAVELADRYSGEADGFERIGERLAESDIVISSTSARNFVIGKELVADAIKKRHHRPIFFIDIAVPRDIDPAIDKLDNVYLYNIDDLKNISEENVEKRMREVDKAQGIIRREAMGFMQWLKTLETQPTIRALKEMFDAIKDEELKKAIGRAKEADDAYIQNLTILGDSIISKIIHFPFTTLKTKAAESHGDLYINAIQDIFKLAERMNESKEPQENTK